MKYISFLFFLLGMVVTGYTQARYNSDLSSLSKTFQDVFRENGWAMNAPLFFYGADFTYESSPFIHGKKVPAISFFRIKDTVQWSRDGKKFRLLDSFIIGNGDIQDSIVYKVIGVYDEDTELQIVDIYKGFHVDHILYINYGVNGEFVGGMRRLKDSLSAYLDSTIYDVCEQGTKVSTYFGIIKPYSLMTVVADDNIIKNAFGRFFAESGITYSPAVRLGKAFYTGYVFDVIKTDSGFLIDDDIAYSEWFFCYIDANLFYFINPLYEHPKTELSFIYDAKWTEEEFLASDDIRAIKKMIDSTVLLKVLKGFYHQERGAFSATYCINIVGE